MRSGASACGATAITVADGAAGGGADWSSSARATTAIVRIATPTVCPSIEYSAWIGRDHTSAGLRLGPQVVRRRRVRLGRGDRQVAAPLPLDEREPVGDDLHDQRVRTDARLRAHDLRIEDPVDRFGREPDDEHELVLGDDGFRRFHPRVAAARWVGFGAGRAGSHPSSAAAAPTGGGPASTVGARASVPVPVAAVAVAPQW